MGMRRQSFETVLEGLSETLALIQSLGLAIEGSRFVGYRERLEHLIATVRSSRPLDTARLQEFTDLEYMVTLTESTEISRILPYLRTCDPDKLRPKLAAILRGPLLPNDEDYNSNQARNFLFELNVAAILWWAGFTPTLGERPDVECEIARAPFLFECKRPFSSGKVVARLNEGSRSLHEILEQRLTGSRGIIAISVSKQLNPGDQIMVVRAGTPDRGRQALIDAIEQVADRTEHAWNKTSPRVAGILFHAIAPILNLTPGPYVIGQQVVVIQFTGADDPQMNLLRTAFSKAA